jgi:hypothetical protein
MKKIVSVLILAAVISSCGKNVTVSLAETALVWRVDDYFDINRSQRDLIKSEFRAALAEVNQQTVPDFEKIIFSKDLVTKSCEQIKSDYQILKPKLETAWITFLRHGYSFIEAVKKEQIDFFLKKVQSDLNDDKIDLKSSSIANEKLERRTKRTLKIWEELFGDLSKTQMDQIKSHLENSKISDRLFFESRQENLNVIKSKSEAEAKAYMKSYLTSWQDQQSTELREASIQRRLSNESFSLNLFCNASPKQKEYFQQTVRDYLDLFRKVYVKPG